MQHRLTSRWVAGPRPNIAVAAGLAGLALAGLATVAGAATTLTTTRVASGLTRPCFVASPPGDDRLFIVEQRGADNRGRVKILKNGAVLAKAFVTTAVLPSGNEQGLYSIAFAPDYATSGEFYLHYTQSPNTNVVVRHFVSANPDTAMPMGQVVYSAPQPFTNHKGGWMAFGPDGYLYLALGDGGSAGDPGDRALDIDVQLGKLHRFDTSGGGMLAGAPDNPFFGPTRGRDEIFAYGLRNPWRCSIDRVTGDLIIGDVGQNVWEEIDFAPATAERGKGWNWGWRCYEGNHSFADSDSIPCGSCALTPQCAFRMPAHEYSHAGGACSVTGGYVYRGCRIPDWDGTYFFADYCSNQISSGRFDANGVLMQVANRTAMLDPAGTLTINSVTSFGEDSRGEMYIVDQGGEIFKIIPNLAGVAEADMPSSQTQTARGTLGATTPGNAITPGITPFARPGSRIVGVGYIGDAAIRECPETVVSAQSVTAFTTHTTLGPWNIDMTSAVDTDSMTLTRTFVFTNTSMLSQPLGFVDIVAPHLNADDDIAQQYQPGTTTATPLLAISEPDHQDLYVTLQGFATGATLNSDVDSLAVIEARIAADTPLAGNTTAGPARCAMAVSFNFGNVPATEARTATLVTQLVDEAPLPSDVEPEIDAIASPILRALGPSPFRDELALAYGPPVSGRVRLEVFDVRGRRVRRLVDGQVERGIHRATWDGRDDGGYVQGAGIYFVRLRTPSGDRSLRVVRVR